MTTRTEAMIDTITEALRARRLEFDGATVGRRLKSVEMRVEFDDSGDVTGLTYAKHERSKVRVSVTN